MSIVVCRACCHDKFVISADERARTATIRCAGCRVVLMTVEPPGPVRAVAAPPHAPSGGPGGYRP